MRKVDHRLSPRVLQKERATDYWDDVLREYNQIETDFLEFFPALQGHVTERQSAAKGCLRARPDFTVDG